MDTQNIIFIYSKHSALCNMLMEKIMRYNLQFIIPISVDKIEIRNRILKSNLNVKYVPTIIIFNKINTEILESEKAALFIESVVNKIEQQNAAKQVENEQSSVPKKSKKESKGFTAIEDLEEEEELDEESDEELDRNIKKIQKERNRTPYRRDLGTLQMGSSYNEQTVEKSLSDKKVDIGTLAKQMEEARNMDIQTKKTSSFE